MKKPWKRLVDSESTTDLKGKRHFNSVEGQNKFVNDETKTLRSSKQSAGDAHSKRRRSSRLFTKVYPHFVSLFLFQITMPRSFSFFYSLTIHNAPTWYLQLVQGCINSRIMASVACHNNIFLLYQMYIYHILWCLSELDALFFIVIVDVQFGIPLRILFILIITVL